jgi:prepilin-type processing-associated H-X9-DG protein
MILLSMDGFDPRNPSQHRIVDYPGSRHAGGATMSFADGRAELWIWTAGLRHSRAPGNASCARGPAMKEKGIYAKLVAPHNTSMRTGQLSRALHLFKTTAVAFITAAGPAFAEPVPERIQASPSSGFHHDYLLVVPTKLENGVPIIVASPTPHTSEDPAEFTEAAERIARNATRFVEPLSAPVLVPVLPRPPVKVAENQHINLHIPGLSRAAMLEKELKLERMDRQVLAMVEHARARIETERGIRAHPKIICTGFSAAGHFATRMAVLHPERVLAVWAGGISGHPILPAAEHQGRKLTYPVGIADLEQISGRPFNVDAFRKIPMMMIQGGADTNTSLPSEPKPSESYTYEQATLVFELFGKTPLERLQKTAKLYEEAGVNLEVKVYPEAAHQITPEIARDMVQFLAKQVAAARQ